MRTVWNDEEEDALQGLPLRAQIIYLRGIRRYMDYASRISGGPGRRISLVMLAETAQESLNRQIQPKASKDAVRASIEQLKRAGLLQRLPDPDYLLFLLPKADADQSGQNHRPSTAPLPPHGRRPAISSNRGADSKADNPPSALRPDWGHRPTHPESGYPDKSNLPDGRAGPSRNPAPPYQAIVDLYHQLLPSLPRVYKLNDARRRRIKALWDDELEDLPSWGHYFRHIGRSDFLLGRIPGRDGSPFLASFDFIIHPGKFIKIAEEQYHGKKIQTPRP